MGANAIAPPPGFTLDSLEPDHPPLPEGFEIDAPKKRKQSNLTSSDQGKLGLADAALSLGTGALAGPISGYAGLLGAALPGPEGQGARWQEATQRALTYEPRTEHGRSVANAIGFIPQKLMDVGHAGGEAVSDATGSPALGAATATGINMLPAIVSRGARPLVDSSIAKVSKAASRNAVKDATLETAQKEGYVVPPDTMLGKVATSIGGKNATKFEASIRNQEVTNKIARREAGLREDEPITPTSLAQARDVMSEPYRQVARLSPVAEQALEGLKQARNDAKQWHAYYERSLDPRALERARRFDSKADGYETQIDNIAASSKTPYLLDALRVARKNLAKNYDVERALNVGSGDVDAAYIGRMLDANPQRMTGGLATIGRFAQGPGRLVTRDASSVPVPGAEHLGVYGSVIGALEGARHFGPKGALIGGGLPLLRGPMRGLALSKFAQPGATEPGLGLKIMDVGSRPIATGAAALTPSLGLQPPREEY